MTRIFVDADACPVKAEVEKVATRHNIPVVLVSNSGMRPSGNPLVSQIVVSDGADAADNWIADAITPRDLCITADIPLAARCLEKSARVLRPTGKAFTPTDIGMALAMREVMRHVREVTGEQTRNAGFSARDRSAFLSSLENTLQALKRQN
jgi:uncharacterized protein YaiI (UPF0178 family)